MPSAVVHPPLGRALMIQGTASHVGKSWLATGICRFLGQDGWRVRPFKAQNMSNNAAVTADGGEIGRSSALQAEAAGVPPHTDMNPVLLKPSGNMTAQLVLQGRPAGTWSAGVAGEVGRARAWRAIGESLGRLRAQADVVVIEGAGGPAELNLRERDLANMAVAELANAPVLLVADIDRGGVFAALLGTLDLLRPHERARVRGLVVNRFRGDPALFADGVRILTERSGLPVLGVLPWLDLALPEEDAAAIDVPSRPAAGDEEGVRAVVVRLPHISNFTDFAALAAAPGVRLEYADRPERALGADLVLVPGSKNAPADLAWLRSRGWPPVLATAPLVLGICGGMQLLGRELRDPHGVEGGGPVAIPGLGLLDVATTYAEDKRTAHTAATVVGGPDWLPRGCRLNGYEIRAGRSECAGEWLRPAGLSAASPDGRVLGCYLHGLFDGEAMQAALVNEMRRRRGLGALPAGAFDHAVRRRQEALDLLASTVRRYLDADVLYRICGLSR